METWRLSPERKRLLLGLVSLLPPHNLHIISLCFVDHTHRNHRCCRMHSRGHSSSPLSRPRHSQCHSRSDSHTHSRCRIRTHVGLSFVCTSLTQVTLRGVRCTCGRHSQVRRSLRPTHSVQWAVPADVFEHQPRGMSPTLFLFRRDCLIQMVRGTHSPERITRSEKENRLKPEVAAHLPAKLPVRQRWLEEHEGKGDLVVTKELRCEKWATSVRTIGLKTGGATTFHRVGAWLLSRSGVSRFFQHVRRVGEPAKSQNCGGFL